jgi:hypothetical protein
MSETTKRRVFNLTGATHEPLPNEAIWDWARRITGDDSVIRSESGMKLVWSHVELFAHNCYLTSAESSNDPDNPGVLENLFAHGHIMMWGHTVFFSDEDSLVMFKLAYSQYMKSCTIVERK